MKKTVVAVLFGGCSTEHEVSLQSAHAVLSHLDVQRFVPLTIGITRQGQWLYYNGPLERIVDGSWCNDHLFCTPCTLSLDKGVHQVVVEGDHRMRFSFDVLFPILHGKNGEDGTVQGLAELMDVPLAGCGTLASALCMDKDRAHRLAQQAGIEVPASAVFERGTSFQDIRRAAEEIGWPLFVKPVRSGSSIGIARVQNQQELQKAVEKAFTHDDRVLLEQEIQGFEVGCAVLGNRELTVGCVDEIELSGGFFDFEEKYTLKTSRIHCPARLSEQDVRRIQQVAKQLYKAMGCRVFARVDLFFTPEGRIVFNEINTIPGFTAHSRYPSMMKAARMDFDHLVSRLVELGMEA